MTQATTDSRATYAKAALILIAVALFATEHLVHYPIAIMALAGVAQFIRNPKLIRDPAIGLVTILFACVWLPMLLAWVGATDPQHAGKTTLSYLHFLPAAWFVLRCGSEPRVLKIVTAGTVSLALFVCFDAVVQLASGRDLFGYPVDDGILKGVFYPKQRLGLFLAVLAPLYLDAVVRWSARFAWSWLILIPMLIVILMSLKRTAWIMLGVGLGAYAVLWLRHHGRMGTRTAVLPVMLGLIVTSALVIFNPDLQQRVQTTSGMLSLDQAALEEASSHRLSLWQTGMKMFVEHWFSGIGPRGFRHTYATYADADDFWLQSNRRGQTHPHLIALEIAVETGVVGIGAFLVLYAVLLRRLWRAPLFDLRALWLLCVVIAWFPLNAHLAFYGSYWSTLVWLALPLGLARDAAAPADG